MAETCSPIINGKRVERWLHEQLDRPLRWKKPRHIILTADLFGDWVTDEKLSEIFAAMAVTPQHTYQVLTKRAERMLEYIKTCWFNEFEWPLPNVWLGVSVEDQKTADERIPHLLNTPAAVRFLSVEPLLGPMRLDQWTEVGLECSQCLWRGWEDVAIPKYDEIEGQEFFCPKCSEICAHTSLNELLGTGINWVIIGGESGPDARPFDIAWARSIIQQCKDAGVPVFTKQLGAKPYDSDLRIATPRSVIVPIDSDWTFTDKLADRKGGDWSEWPEDLRIREFPKCLDHIGG